MRDICDGSFVKNHPLFQHHPTALQFILYYDDIEVCNPLGSSAGIHKLGKILYVSVSIVKYTCITFYYTIGIGIFYYTLGNIRPVFRSMLPSMQLLAIANAKDIHTFGCEALLQPFVDQMKLLAEVR